MLFTTTSFLGALGFLLLRVALGAVFIYHGYGKFKNYKAMAQGMGVPASFVFMLGVVELLSGLSVLTGAFEQLGALGISVVMLGALYHKIFKWHTPFSGTQGTGWEFDLVLLGAALLILFNGDGGLTLCRFLQMCPQL